MKSKKSEEEKWERIHEYEDCVVIWKYNSNISKINPYEVEVKDKQETETKQTKTRKQKV